MTEALTAELTALAEEVGAPPLDMHAVRRSAGRRRAHRRLSAALVVTVIACAGTAAVSLRLFGSDAQSEQLIPSAPKIVSAPGVPSEARLNEVLGALSPPETAGKVNWTPAGPLGVNSSVLGALGRRRTLPSLATTTTAGTFVGWSAIDPPLTSVEADRIARGITPPDPNPITPPPAVPVALPGQPGGSIRSLAYAYGGEVRVLTWAENGGVVITAVAGTPQDITRAAKLASIGSALLGPAIPRSVLATPPSGASTTPSASLTAAAHVALWPETDRSVVPATYPRWRGSAAGTTSYFASAVLGWRNPVVRTIKSRFRVEQGVQTLAVSPRAGARAVEVHAARVFDAQHWSITYMWGFGAEQPPASVSISRAKGDIRFGYWNDSATATLLVTYGRHHIERTSSSSAHWNVPITFPININGAVIVLFKNGSGEVTTGWGTALTAGPVAAG